MSSPRKLALGVAPLAFLGDRLSKTAILTLLEERTSLEIAPFLNFTLTFNQGISFGLFPRGGLLIPLVMLAVMGGLVVWLWRLPPFQKSLASGIGLVLGGAAGNLYDRIFYGGVVDFLDFHLYNFHWFVFNLADVFIFTGVAILVLTKPKKEDSPR